MFIDAQEMARMHPDTFGAPSADELGRIDVGDSVKVCADNVERFWVTVTELNGDCLAGIVDNNLICTDQHGLKFGDIVKFKKCNIYSIY